MIADDHRPLAHRPFRVLLAARTVDMLGNAMAPVALAFAVLDLTGSTTDLGVVVASRSATNVALLLVGGVVADRMSRATVLVWSNVASALTQAAVAALVLTGGAAIPLLAALSALNGAAAAVSMPAAAAMLPETVPEVARERANALNRLGVNAALIGGSSLGGLLVALVGPGWGLALDAGTFAATAVLFSLIAGRPPVVAADVVPTVWADLRAGWAAFTSATWIWIVVAAFMLINAAWAGSSVVLGPAVADRSIGRAGWGLVLGAQTVGLIVGGLSAMRWHPRHPMRVGMLAAAALAAVPLGLGLRPVLAVLLPAALVAGMGIETFGVAWDNALQAHVPRHQLARVYAYDMLGSFVAIPLGEIAVGPLGEIFGLQPVLLALAATIGLSSLAALTASSVRNLQRGAATPAPTSAPPPA